MLHRNAQQATLALVRLMVCIAFASLLSACAAASRPPETNAPRSKGSSYPIVLSASDERRTNALAAWSNITSAQGISDAPAPELQPITATLLRLPQLNSNLRLPEVSENGDNEPKEEERRESLRRFIATAEPLLGVTSRFLSLLEITAANDGTKRARYEQRPFLYPLRGGFGRIEIDFSADGRVIQLSSTAIPDVDRLNRAITNARPQITAEDAAKRVTGRTITYTDASGIEQTRTTTEASNDIKARELVIYPLKSDDDPATLNLHLAWEIAIGSDDLPLLVYVDSVTGETIASRVRSDK